MNRHREYVNAREIADRTELPTSTIYALTSSGKIPCIRKRAQFWYDPDVVVPIIKKMQNPCIGNINI